MSSSGFSIKKMLDLSDLKNVYNLRDLYNLGKKKVNKLRYAIEILYKSQHWSQ